MSAPFSSEFPASRLPDNLDLEMLRHAQACLHCRHRHQIPSDTQGRAWDWFYQTYDPLLRHWVVGCHVPVDAVEDCLQDIWTEVVRTFGAFASDGSQGRLCS